MEGDRSGSASGSANGVDNAEAEDRQWQDIPRRRSTQATAGRQKRKRPSSRRRVVWKKSEHRVASAESTPMMVADFVFRKQVEWLVENTGVRDEFKEVAQKIWFSYLAYYMPDLKNGLESELGGHKHWHLAFPHEEVWTMLNCSRRELATQLRGLQQRHPSTESDRPRTRLTRDFGALKQYAIQNSLRNFRPTAATLLAIIALALHVCREEIVLSDLLRWVRGLKLPLTDMGPYKATASPAELRGLTRKANYLHGTCRYSQVEARINALAAALSADQVSRLPGLPMAPFVERFVQELNLPTEMIPFVMGLLERINTVEYHVEHASVRSILPCSGYRRGKNMESLLMSCIFYALRLLFVLDDATEKTISLATGRMQELLPHVRLFDFGAWYQHLMHRRALLFKHTMLSRQAYGAEAHTAFIQRNMGPDPTDRTKYPASLWKTKAMQKRYRELQRSWQRLNSPAGSRASVALFIDLPVTVRPYRAHTEALSQHYPELAVDFGKHTIKHLLDDRSWLKELAMGSERQKEANVNVSTIQENRSNAFGGTPLFRLYRNNDGSKRLKLLEEENLPRVTRDLVRTMADMIDQLPSYLFGNLVFLDLALFPNNPMCAKTGHGRYLKVLKAV